MSGNGRKKSYITIQLIQTDKKSIMSQTDVRKLGFTRVSFTFLTPHIKCWKTAVLDFQ